MPISTAAVFTSNTHPQCLTDSLYILLIHISMHRQRKTPTAYVFRNRVSTIQKIVGSKCLLPVHGFLIINRRRYMVLIEPPYSLFPLLTIRKAYCILCPARRCILSNNRRFDKPPQLSGILFCSLIAQSDLLVKNFSFSIKTAACSVSSLEFIPIRTLSYLSAPFPCTL